MIHFSIILSVFLNIFIPVENPANTKGDADIPLLSKVIIDSKLYSVYIYTVAYLISEEQSNSQFIKHNYNAKNQLISSDYYVDYTLAGSSNITDKIRKEWINPDNSAKDYSILFEYNDKGQLTKSTDRSIYNTYKFDSKNRISLQNIYKENKLSGYIDYNYDRNGNMQKMSQYEIFPSGHLQLITTYEYEFDTKPNPYRAFRSLMIPGKNTNYNNITKEIYTLHFMVHEINDKQITEYKYTYNENGYPKSVNNTTEYFYK
jgi:hypothetical protein